MKNKLLTLLKLELRRMYGLNKLVNSKAKSQRSKLKKNLALVIVLFIIMMSSVYTYFMLFAAAFSEMGKGEYLFTVANTAASMLCMITAVLSGANALFIFKDYDTLMSMPVSRNTLAFSRIINLYISNTFFMLCIMIPGIAAYATFNAVNVYMIVAYVLLMFITPMLPIVLASAVSILIAKAASYLSKKHRDHVRTAITMIFFMGIVVLSSMSGRLAEIDSAQMNMIFDKMSATYPIANWFTKALMGDIKYLIAFIAVNVVPFIGFGVLTSKLMVTMHEALKSTRKIEKQKGAVKEIKKSKVGAALLKKEFKRYFSSSLYVLNTLMGAILSVIATTALIFLKNKPEFVEIKSVLESMGVNVSILVTAALAMFLGLGTTTTASISIERNGIWQLKVLPIEAKEIYKAKLNMNYLINLTAAVICAALICFAFNASVQTIICVFLTLISFVIFMGVLGLRLNMASPKFDWKNEQEVVKQGIPMMIMVFSSMIISAVLIALLFAQKLLTSEQVALVFSAIFIAASCLIWMNISKKGEEIFRNF